MEDNMFGLSGLEGFVADDWYSISVLLREVEGGTISAIALGRNLRDRGYVEFNDGNKVPIRFGNIVKGEDGVKQLNDRINFIVKLSKVMYKNFKVARYLLYDYMDTELKRVLCGEDVKSVNGVSGEVDLDSYYNSLNDIGFEKEGGLFIRYGKRLDFTLEVQGNTMVLICRREVYDTGLTVGDEGISEMGRRIDTVETINNDIVLAIDGIKDELDSNIIKMLGVLLNG